MSDPSSKRPPNLLDPIFSPRSVAIVGASRRRDSISFALLHNLVLREFQGTIFPVNPHADSIHSLKAYPAWPRFPIRWISWSSWCRGGLSWASSKSASNAM